MKVTVNGEAHQILDPEELTWVEVDAIEKATGTTAGEWAKGSISTIAGLVWVTLKRGDPTLKLVDVMFTMGDIDMSDEEDDPGDEGKAPATVSSKPKPKST